MATISRTPSKRRLKQSSTSRFHSSWLDIGTRRLLLILGESAFTTIQLGVVLRNSHSGAVAISATASESSKRSMLICGRKSKASVGSTEADGGLQRVERKKV